MPRHPRFLFNRSRGAGKGKSGDATRKAGQEELNCNLQGLILRRRGSLRYESSGPQGTLNRRPRPNARQELTAPPRACVREWFDRRAFPYAYLRVPLHQVPEALQRRAIDQRARQAPPHLPEMQVAGGEADVLDVLRQDRSQELTGRGPSACGVRAAARNRGEARSHGRANDLLGLQVLSLRKTFRVIFTPP